MSTSSSARRPARKPAPRTARVEIREGDFEGWEATVRADFPAKILADLQSGKVERILAAFEVIVLEHNLPGPDDPETGEPTIAERLEDVEPYDGLLKVAGEALKAIGRLPPR